MTKKRLAGEICLWVVSVFLALVCLRSGLMKMPGVPGHQFWERDFQRWGYPGWFRIAVGLAELASFALLLVPRSATVGAALFAAVMLGAMVTHAAHGETGRVPFNVLLLVLSLLVAFGRAPAVGRRARAGVP